MEDSTVCFGIKDAVVSLSHSNVDEDELIWIMQFLETPSGQNQRGFQQQAQTVVFLLGMACSTQAM
ncbi:hypothetical protein T10_8178 [Trichinella papuae]|uniref:Uncharacterized protein n=1 Tax=Trichinella papuae TaxID=268474 RepID=A0A0V1MW18_9BILA|nr:hypothetical protein T10_8178 [Trichinella papuae]